MNPITTIFRKELTDTLRDKRTIITMVVIPLIAIPIMMALVIRLAQRQAEQAEAEESRVAFVGRDHAPALYEKFVADSNFTIREDVAVNDIEQLIRDDSLDGAIEVPASFQGLIDIDDQAAVTIYFRSSNQLNATQERMTDIIETFDSTVVNGRIQRLGLEERMFDAVDVVTHDVSSLQEVLGKTVGGILPYIFVAFLFTGAMYPGIDLGAGEKERGTLETLLSSPASRFQIVLGKFFVVALVGLASALISIVGLYLGVRASTDIPPEINEVMFDILTPSVVGMIATLLVPLAVFFAAMILAVSIHAKSFKEAQSSLTPLSFFVFVPVALGFLPGVELNLVTSLIPILNVSLATKDVIAGTIDPLHLSLTYLSLFALAGASLAFCVAWFKRESTLFRT